MCICIRTYTLPCLHAYVHTYITHIWWHTHAHILQTRTPQTRTNTHTHTLTCTRSDIYIDTCIHTHTHTNTHKRTHHNTHTRTHIHTTTNLHTYVFVTLACVWVRDSLWEFVRAKDVAFCTHCKVNFLCTSNPHTPTSNPPRYSSVAGRGAKLGGQKRA